jgi:hypothetical protein
MYCTERGRIIRGRNVRGRSTKLTKLDANAKEMESDRISPIMGEELEERLRKRERERERMI